MANHVSSLKRARQTETRTEVNRSNRSRVRTSLRDLREALAKGDVKAAQAQYRETVSALDKSVQKGILHDNTVSRYKSRLNARLKTLAITTIRPRPAPNRQKRSKAQLNRFSKSAETAGTNPGYSFFANNYGVHASIQPLKNPRRAHSAAHAHRHHAVANLSTPHLAQQCRGEFRSGAAQRMPQRNGASVHVHPLRIEPQFANDRQRLRSKRLVQFDQPDLVQPEPGPLQRLGNRGNRSNAHLLRQAAGCRVSHQPSQRLDP